MAEIKYLDLTGLQRYDQKIKEVVNTGLDDKIGKDDVMLEELLSSWTGNGLLETPYMTNNWSARVEGIGGEYIPTTIYNENDEVIFVLPSSEELEVANFPALGYIYTHNNGNLSILVELMDAPENYTANIQIDPTSTYKLVFGDNAYYVKLTGDIYAELPTNTKKSFEKLNKSIVRFDSEIKELDENKADKTEVDQKIGKEDGMIMVPSEPTTYTITYPGQENFTTSLFNGTNWTVECILNPGNEFINLVLLNQNDHLIKEIGYLNKKLILTNDNGTVTINKDDQINEQISTVTIDPSKSYKLWARDNRMDPSSHIDITITKSDDTTLNTQESLNYLNENKADKTEVESSLALKADKTEVESSLALKADKASTENAISNLEDTKIGKDDEMLIVSFESTTNTTTYSGQGSFTTNLVNGTIWTVECTLNHDDDSINFVLLDQEEVFNNELGGFKQKLILTNVNGTLTINKDEQIRTITIDPSKSYKLYALDIYVDPSSHVDVTITQGGDAILNTQKSLSYLNENKADKSDIKEILLGEHDLGDSVIFHDSDSFTQGPGLDGSIPLEPGYVYFSTISEFDISDASYEEKLIGRVAGFDSKANAEDLPTAVSQLSNDAGYAVAGDLKIAEVTEGLGENVAKAYKFEGGAESAVIEIPKDQTLKSVELGKIVDDTFVVDPTGEILRFTYIIADGSEKVVDVNVSNLITEAELDPVYNLIDTKLDAADVLTVSNDEIDAMFD